MDVEISSKPRQGRYNSTSCFFYPGENGLPLDGPLWEETLITEGVFSGTYLIWNGRQWIGSAEAEYKYGLLCGYPECCVKSFCDGRMGPQLRQEYGNVEFGLGYVPCKDCCERILKGRAKCRVLQPSPI